jgi:hypothetical protein
MSAGDVRWPAAPRRHRDPNHDLLPSCPPHPASLVAHVGVAAANSFAREAQTLIVGYFNE